MNFIKGVFKFYVYSNLHVSVAIWALVRLTGYFFYIDTTFSAFFVGCSTLLSYNLIRFVKLRKHTNRHVMAAWCKIHDIPLKVINGLAVIGLIYCMFYIPMRALFVVVPFAIITVLYMLPVFKIKNKSVSLRTLPGIKIFSIAVSWSGMVVVFPLVVNGFPINAQVKWFFLQQILFVLVLTLPFDIRDIDFDSKELKTIPQRLGLVKTKAFGILLLILVLGINYNFFIEGDFLSTLGMVCLLGTLLLFSKKEQSVYYSSFLVEAVPIFWCVLLGGMQFFLK